MNATLLADIRTCALEAELAGFQALDERWQAARRVLAWLAAQERPVVPGTGEDDMTWAAPETKAG
jgi:hypothetical protein